VAAMGRSVVAVDADPVNLAYTRRSLDMENTTRRVKILYNSVSDTYIRMYPYQPDESNAGGTVMKTEKEMKDEWLKPSGPVLTSVTMADILNIVEEVTVIIKIDIEGYECKALLPDILLGKTGKSIPLIFMEWGNLSKDRVNCGNYYTFVDNFFSGGYKPYQPGNLKEFSKDEIDYQWDLLWIHRTFKVESFRTKFNITVEEPVQADIQPWYNQNYYDALKINADNNINNLQDIAKEEKPNNIFNEDKPVQGVQEESNDNLNKNPKDNDIKQNVMIERRSDSNETVVEDKIDDDQNGNQIELVPESLLVH